MFTFNFYLFICFKLMEQRIVILKKHFVKILKQFSFGVFFLCLLFCLGFCCCLRLGLAM
jgi:hypothetical protein